MEVIGHYHDSLAVDATSFLAGFMSDTGATDVERGKLTGSESTESFVFVEFEGGDLGESTTTEKTAASCNEEEYLDALCEECVYPEQVGSASQDFGYDFEDVSKFLPTALLKKSR
eukprot:TRINITY_DN3526_c0_g1_i1.p1 TRINITY_DN3526_c0_g1~~TRINITY_DN3526_c0_g1_i1.p1  ORF type:complete len:132 (+),score=30.06 TRINITY_DN3526_c0_g1_i1:52-396(+)